MENPVTRYSLGQKISLVLKIYFLLIILFVVQKILFMLYYHEIFKDFHLSDFLAVIGHGLKLDISMAAYLTLFPGMLLIASYWLKSNITRALFLGYFLIIGFFISIVFIADLGLYEHWGFRLDTTPLFYLHTPKDALASVPTLLLVFAAVCFVAIAVFIYLLFKRLFANKLSTGFELRPFKKTLYSFLLLLALSLFFVPIRGGFTVATLNVGQVYFNKNIELNHAAINPMFSFLESLTLEHNFQRNYRYMEQKEANAIVSTLVDNSNSEPDKKLFTVKRPNVIIVILESFMSKVIEPLGGEFGVTPRLNELCQEGILFTNFYANSFRTDRGLVSIISGYPSQPITSIMKYPSKTQSLPSIPRSLGAVGYDLKYYYGGDADFTNMRSYLVSMGMNEIVSYNDFPLMERLSKWGAHDNLLFSYLTEDIKRQTTHPYLKIIQTLSSHEPFEVPAKKRFDNIYLNSVAFTDSCLGSFIDELKLTPEWKNTVVFFVPDHCMRYPVSLTYFDLARYQIPLLIVGGAVKNPMKVDTYASQIDIAATLLAQLELPHNDFIFSKDIFDPASPHFGYFSFPDGFGMVTPENAYIFDNQAKKTMLNTGQTDFNKKKVEAYIQVIYDDMSKR